jgi:hypothetical protein
MPDRAIDRRRRREPGRDPAEVPLSQHSSEPILALQRSAGNRAVADMLARAPAEKGATGSVEIAGIGKIAVSGGNLQEWTEKGAVFDTVEVTSQKGRHSTKLEKLSKAGTKMDFKVTIAAAIKEGEELNVGGGTLLNVLDAKVSGYGVDGEAETWRLSDFQDVKRTKVTRKVS